MDFRLFYARNGQFPAETGMKSLVTYTKWTTLAKLIDDPANRINKARAAKWC